MTRALRVAAGAAAAAALLAGCAGGPGPSTPPGRVTSARTRVAPGQNGLEVVTWQVTDDGRRLADALQQFAAPAAAGADELALRANGFVLWPVRAGELDALLAAMGGSPLNLQTWMGAAPTWRELVAAPVGDALVEIDSVARERPGATVRLMARSWPVPMEDGGRIALDLVPQVVTSTAEASLLRHGERLAGEVVRSCAMELELERGVAWVLTCDPAGMVELERPAAPTEEAAPPVATEPPPPEPGSAPPQEPTTPGTTPPAAPPSATPPATAPPATAPPVPPAAPPPAAPPATAPPLQPAPVDRPPVRSSRPTSDPPLEAPRQRATPPAPETPPAPPTNSPAPPPASPRLALARALLAAALAAPPEQSRPPRLTTLGTALLLASPERAGMPARRTVLVFVPHLDAMPFPDDAPPPPRR